MNKPNIHMFSLYNEFYFYDVNTNAIVKIPQEIYAYLQEIMDGKENLIKSKTIENGIFSCHIRMQNRADIEPFVPLEERK